MKKSYKIEITVTVEGVPDDMIDILSRNVHFAVGQGDLFGTLYQGVKKVHTWDLDVTEVEEIEVEP